MSGLTREIVTLQAGHYANFVGTHWWNIQVNTINIVINQFPNFTISKENSGRHTAYFV